MKLERKTIGIRPSNGLSRTTVSIWDLVQWAFQRELASLDFNPVRSVATGSLPGFGLEYVMMERAALGCRIDGGGSSDPHPDAQLVADAIASLPESHGGRGQALSIAELARSGRLPDCMIGAVPRFVPTMVGRENQHGQKAKTESAGTESYIVRGRVRSFDRRYCPVRVTPTAAEIAAARRRYLRFWGALLYLRQSLSGPGLTSFALTDAMPPLRPWEKTA